MKINDSFPARLLGQGLRQAAITARDLGESKLTTVCKSFEKQVGDMAENYEKPTTTQMDLIGKLHMAFEQVRT